MSRLPKFQRIINTTDGTRYMTRLVWGRARLHIFHRGDLDPDLHDHPWGFWTFPLTTYVEEVRSDDGLTECRLVRSFRLHYRPAEFAHRVIGRWNGLKRRHPQQSLFWMIDRRPIVTLVWRTHKSRSWGFHRQDSDAWCFIPWRRYVFEPGAKSAPCADVGEVRA